MSYKVFMQSAATIRELLAQLLALPGALRLPYGFDKVFPTRWDYSTLGLSPASYVRVDEMCRLLQEALGEDGLETYKGGSQRFYPDSLVGTAYEGEDSQPGPAPKLPKFD